MKKSTAWIFLYVAIFLVLAYFFFTVSVEGFKEGGQRGQANCPSFTQQRICEKDNSMCKWSAGKCINQQ